MHLFLNIVIYTANILGIFTDPFEFEGDYDVEVNSVRKKVFELVISKEALARNLTDDEVNRLMLENVIDYEPRKYREVLITQGSEEDRQNGPTLLQLMPPELVKELVQKQKELQSPEFTQADLQEMLSFIESYRDQKVFYFFRNHPHAFLSLDKILKDQASIKGKDFDLPILGSPKILKGQNSHDLKKDLLDAVFIEQILKLTKADAAQRVLNKLDKDFLKQFFGEKAKTQDLSVFCTPAGQVFFYWLYHSLNLHLISKDHQFIKQVNKVKDIFIHTLGDPQVRAHGLREKLIAADSGVLFTQESETFVQALLEEGFFLPVERQNPQDGTFVFLRRGLWETDYEIVAIEGYEGYQEGRLTLVLATRKQTGEKFLLVSGHGHSTQSEDGRLQISLAMEKFHQLSQKPKNVGLQLLIGIDANTKTEEDVKLFHEHLERLGLVATSVGPTTVKRRMVTAQHSKAGRMAVDEEDYLITLKPQNGGRFVLTHPTVGFDAEKPNLSKMLPNLQNPSDHYPIGAVLEGL